MVIKSCPVCATTFPTDTATCPFCNVPLVHDVQIQVEEHPSQTVTTTSVPSVVATSEPAAFSLNNYVQQPVATPPTPVMAPRAEPATENAADRSNGITGTVRYYTVETPPLYRRLWPRKIIDMVLYRQRLHDVRHNFQLEIYDSKTDSTTWEHCVLHGSFASNSAGFNDGATVTVRGRTHNGMLYVSRMSNTTFGSSTPVVMQHSWQEGAVLAAILCGLWLVLGLVLPLFANAGSIGTSLNQWLYGATRSLKSALVHLFSMAVNLLLVVGGISYLCVHHLPRFVRRCIGPVIALGILCQIL